MLGQASFPTSSMGNAPQGRSCVVGQSRRSHQVHERSVACVLITERFIDDLLANDICVRR